MLFRLLFIFFFVFIALLGVQSQNTPSQTFWPAALPLAVRSPYLSAWLFTTNGSQSTNTWPTFWNNDGPLGWAGHVRIDNTTYRWLGGDPGPNVTILINTQITPTQTIWTIQAGPMDLTITFLTRSSLQIGSGSQFHSHISRFRRRRMTVKHMTFKSILILAQSGSLGIEPR
ncbi:hypothetical protein B0H21DRAFT_179419 [Amylocystis lapponica]|nr:hypothetical protein B0H21DRAFT_179419 [Amylocystis lapponica]